MIYNTKHTLHHSSHPHANAYPTFKALRMGFGRHSSPHAKPLVPQLCSSHVPKTSYFPNNHYFKEKNHSPKDTKHSPKQESTFPKKSNLSPKEERHFSQQGNRFAKEKHLQPKKKIIFKKKKS